MGTCRGIYSHRARLERSVSLTATAYQGISPGLVGQISVLSALYSRTHRVPLVISGLLRRRVPASPVIHLPAYVRMM
jgi:hypothetical protein